MQNSLRDRAGIDPVLSVTFTDDNHPYAAGVASASAAMQNMRRLQADVTANNAENRALMKRCQLFGPPGVILFDASGKEVPPARVIGFMPARAFLRQLRRAAG